MFATYVYNGGASIKQIFADIKAILTGTTDKNTLSASCDKSATSITATVAAGWSATTGGLSVPDVRPIQETGILSTKPVSNGSYILWPVWGTNKIMKSTDGGDTWTYNTLPLTLGVPTLADTVQYQPLLWNGTYWLLFDPTVSIANVYTSTDGVTWTTRSLPSAQQIGNSTWSNSLWVLVPITNQANVFTSADGVTWTARTLPASAPWGKAVFGGGIWVITQNNQSTGSVARTALATSPDGITWTSRTITSYPTWTPKFFNGTLWILDQPPGVTSTTILTSSDGITWTSRAIGSASCNAVEFADGVYYWTLREYVGATTGRIYISNDGINWSLTLSVASLCRVYFSTTKGLWIAVVSGTTFYTSTDGTVWTARIVPSFTLTTSGRSANILKLVASFSYLVVQAQRFITTHTMV